MKILQVISYFYPACAYGGPPRTVYELSRELVKRGHEVTVYTTDSLDPKNRMKIPSQKKALEVNGTEVYYFRNLSNWLAGKHHLFLPPFLIKAARDHLKEFDVIHLHDARTLVHIPVQHYAQKYGIPYVVQPHGSATTFFQKRGLKRIFDRLWGYKILKDASKVIALTRTEAEQCKSMGVSEDKIEIIPNGINLSEFDNLPQRGEFRGKYGLDDSQKIILYLGRIHKIKGPDLLAKAFAELSKDFSDAKLVIVGPDDGYLTQLKELIAALKISSEIIFTGPMYGRDKLEAYVDADVYVLPSISDGFPVSVLESCACGTPVIITEGCGMADIIDGQAGLVILYDKNQLSTAILHMLSEQKMRQQLGENGKSLVRERFNWERIAEQVEDMYRSCIQMGTIGGKAP